MQAATNQRCGQPGQQHGLFMPLRILSIPILMRRILVSAFLGEVTQQIHSLRANGVNVSQRLFARRSATIAFWRSSGSLCTTQVRLPFKISFNKLNFSVRYQSPAKPVVPPMLAGGCWADSVFISLRNSYWIYKIN